MLNLIKEISKLQFIVQTFYPRKQLLKTMNLGLKIPSIKKEEFQ
jgi:hypothetical protein